MAGADPRPAFYALAPGGWRDYWTLLHPPYTAWHLSYVTIGAAISPRFDAARWGVTLLAFFLGVGLSAHALDELSGRPLGTKIPDGVLKAIAGISLLLAAALGVVVASDVSWWLLGFVAFGAFIVVAYNLELFQGMFHGDLWFAVAWGAFPAVTGYFAQTGSFDRGGNFSWDVVLAALACLWLSAAQRRLSTPVRRLRRQVVAVEGRVIYRGGAQERVDDALLRAAPESALRAMALGLVLLAAGLVAARLL